MSKAALPDVKTGDLQLDQFLSNAKQNLDELFGQKRGSKPIATLPASASLSEVIELLNTIVERIK